MPGTEAKAADLAGAYMEAQRKSAEEAARMAGGVHEAGLTGERTGEREMPER